MNLKPSYNELLARYRAIEQRVALLQTQSMTDDVTGLYNHRHLLEEIDREVERTKRHGRALCGMMIDIDNFKSVNDRFGHPAGDAVLRRFAELLNGSVRRIDIVGRYGGDEFIVILPETDLRSAQIVAERIQKNIGQEPFDVGDRHIQLTLSVGAAYFKDIHALTTSAFIEQVDKAMFQAKSLGKNRIHAVLSA
ncbi:MAG: GGDEF domain-containing protein [Candidatus Omnitrophica bacterium]|nr:GGDEF domain-containing protein [Candidatus Omnitrophota bacterium]